MLSAFGDEIDPDPGRQLDALEGEGIRHLDLRGAWGKNVLRLSDEEVKRLAELCADRGVRVAVIASPIGKIGVADDFAPHLDDFRRALALAGRFGAPAVRVFSFYVPVAEDPTRHREAVLEKVGRLVREAEGTGVTLLHENEKGIYGDTPERCHDLLTAIGSPILRAVWDPANFVQCGVRPFAEGYALLRPFIAAVHVKDARRESGEVVPAGEGDGEWPETLAALRDSGFAGVCSLEPHLAAAGPFAGFSGPGQFRRAARAFTTLLREQGVAWA